MTKKIPKLFAMIREKERCDTKWWQHLIKLFVIQIDCFVVGFAFAQRH